MCTAARERRRGAEVVRVTNPARLFDAVQVRAGLADAATWILSNDVTHRALGASKFGQAGSLEHIYRYHGIDTDSIGRAALELAT